MGFSAEERMLIKMCTFLKVMQQRKDLLRNFRINVGTAGTEQTVEKAARKSHDGKTKLQH